jgi:tetratricopeptide (TPR) repeat protein
MLSLAAWGNALGIDVSSLLDEESRALAVRDAIADRRMLLVIDDAWDIGIANFLKCGGPNCSHLLTTGDSSIGRSFAGPHNSYQIDVLRALDTFDLLQVLAPDFYSVNPEAVWRLSENLGGLPLAARLLGGFLSSPELSAPFNMDPDLAGPIGRADLALSVIGPGSEPDVALPQLMALCLNSLPADILDGLRSLGVFAPDPEDFGRDAATAVSNLPDAALDLLVARFLLNRRGDRLTLHPVVADHIRDQVPQDAQARHWDHYLSLINEGRQSWTDIEADYGQIRQAWSQMKDPGRLTAMANAAQPFQQQRGLRREHMEWTNRILHTAGSDETGGPGSAALIRLGLDPPESGHHQDEVEFYTRAVSVLEDVGDREGMASALNNLGRVHYALGQWETALANLSRALPIMEELGDRQSAAIVLNNLGSVHCELGHLITAREYLDRTLPIMEELENHRGLATAINNSGVVRDGLGLQNEALKLYNRALPIMDKLNEHAGVASILNNMGCAYESLGHDHLALEFYNRALSVLEELGDPAGMSTVLNNQGSVLHSLNQSEMALGLYRRSLDLMKEMGNTAGIATVLNNMGSAYNSLGHPDLALEYYIQAVAVLEEAGDRASLATTLNNMGSIHDTQGRRDQALEFYLRALPIRIEVGEQHGEAVTRYYLANVYIQTGQLTEAESHLAQAVEIFGALRDSNTQQAQERLLTVRQQLADGLQETS